MDARARKILDDAFATCARVDLLLKNLPEREPTIEPVAQWTPPVREQRRKLDTMPHDPAADKAEFDRLWNEWFARRFAEHFEANMAEYSETVISVNFKRMDKHKRELEAELVKLRSELNLLREVRSGGSVVELKKA